MSFKQLLFNNFIKNKDKIIIELIFYVFNPLSLFSFATLISQAESYSTFPIKV